MEFQGTKNNRNNLDNNLGGLILSDFKAYHKAILNQDSVLAQGQMKINGKESKVTNKSTHLWSPDF